MEARGPYNAEVNKKEVSRCGELLGVRRQGMLGETRIEIVVASR